MVDLFVAGPPGLVRTAIVRLIENGDDVHLAGEANLGDSILEATADQPPDVLVLVVPRTEEVSFKTIRALKDGAPSSGILVLSTQTDRQTVIRMLNPGADGHVSLQVGEDEFLEAVRVVASGNRYVCPCCRDEEVERALQSRDTPWPEPHDQITDRESEVLNLVRDGLSPYEIARRLSISPRTVEKHLRNARNKLGIPDHQALFSYLLAYEG